MWGDDDLAFCEGAPLLSWGYHMNFIGTRARGWLSVFKNPADALAPYRVRMQLPDCRPYEGRVRSHPTANNNFWYEGFVTACRAIDYAHDQQLVRYPAKPEIAPTRWNLLPCQMKLTPYPVGGDKDGMIGSVWVSRRDGNPGGEVFTILATQREHGSIVIAGDVLCYRQPARPACQPKQHSMGTRHVVPERKRCA